MKQQRAMQWLTAAMLAMTVEAQAMGPAPSWELITPPVGNSCDRTSGNLTLSVDINAPNPASEQGVLSAPGNPNLGITEDSTVTGVFSAQSFTVFHSSPGAALAPNTPLTLRVVTYNGPNFTGGAAYESILTWNCTTGAIISSSNRVISISHNVPTLSPLVLALLGLGVAGLGAASLSRRAR